jgi:invasion protein IalB
MTADQIDYGDEMSTKLFAITAFALTALASTVQAQPSPDMVKKYNDWGLYSYKSGAATVCYALTTPTKMLPANVTHGDNYFLVAPNASGGGYYPQAIMGYDLRAGSNMTVTIGDQTFAMVPKGNSGWTQQASNDAQMIAAMKSGSDMTLQAVSARGTQTSYTFSLAGISAALEQASRCR